MPNKVMTVKEVAEYLRCHESTIYRMLRRRQLPAFKIGTDWRFHIDAIQNWQAQATERLANEAPVITQ
ncbi:MAG TPA: helix-turn-helix domain-containing protein [Candidatus Binataceae bacterium]